MGLFDVFSKGGKYFGKAIEPKCEYCEFGKRAKDGDKVLCAKKGLVDASYHCPKFIYSPLKRIPVKQMKMVGFLEGDYDDKSEDEDDNAANKASNPSAHAPANDNFTPAQPAAEAAATSAPEVDSPKPVETAPAEAKAEPAVEAQPEPVAPEVAPEPQPKAEKPAKAASASADTLDALAALVDATAETDADATDVAEPEAAATEESPADATAMSTL